MYLYKTMATVFVHEKGDWSLNVVFIITTDIPSAGPTITNTTEFERFLMHANLLHTQIYYTHSHCISKYRCIFPGNSITEQCILTSYTKIYTRGIFELITLYFIVNY